jgi:hypothetical protein
MRKVSKVVSWGDKRSYLVKDMTRLQLLYNSCITPTTFLKLNIGYIGPTYKKTDPIISLKKKLLELYKSCIKYC